MAKAFRNQIKGQEREVLAELELVGYWTLCKRHPDWHIKDPLTMQRWYDNQPNRKGKSIFGCGIDTGDGLSSIPTIEKLISAICKEAVRVALENKALNQAYQRERELRKIQNEWDEPMVLNQLANLLLQLRATNGHADRERLLCTVKNE